MQVSEDRLLHACRLLFGMEVTLGQSFLAYLQPSGAKSAYRQQIKVHHPDRFAIASREIRERQTEHFREIHSAYQLLMHYLEKRQKTASRFYTKVHPRPTPPPSSTPASARDKQPRHPSPPQNRSRVPNIPLQFGMFAYYADKINYPDLIKALVWQRSQRPPIGKLAQRWGWLTEQQVADILSHRGPSRRFGQKAVELKLLQTVQVEALLFHQRSQQQRLGQYFIIRGLLNQREVDDLARRLDLHNTRLRRQSA